MRITIPKKRAPRHRAEPGAPLTFACQHCSKVIDHSPVLTWIDGGLLRVCIPCLTASDELEMAGGLAR